MDLSTSYLGLELRNPLVVSASPLSEEVSSIKRMEDAGAAAVVLYSLFEEQIRHEQRELYHHLTESTESYAEALSFFPEPSEFHLAPSEYLNHIRKAKEAVNIPIIASINGSEVGDWLHYAKLMEEAGADAIELNIYAIPTNPSATAADIENNYINILKCLKSSVTVPVAIKLSPFFTNLGNFAERLVDAGANSLVLFNRFYQPDIDLENLEVVPNVVLSTSQARRLPLRWIAILYGRIQADLAATSGIHHAQDVLKMLMAGANITMLCSALLRNGIDQIKIIEREMLEWMELHEYESVRQMLGSMSQKNIADPSAFERAQYMKALRSFRPQI
ncbi:dihydroorotate dehydrogenase [Chloroherpeton thalassium ATCC 35110]|uniref:Dihydroorotate dehydrogenase n=1 Tax=Chloroherpeton thalassium (strain ATCC 35110 / GB-78) TaxID=517418 RepID=B3QW98_CHLT3|nr:dihydroorotate dehydrogenase-like protein [Chloroherpeton thalassium]ACF13211.1 dihydroorotate dehydrogenase [Chloroherpeton thalassium ATCC 35110]